MELIRGLVNLSNLSGCVVTIGNFDGLHLGHQKIIKNLVDKAKELSLPSVVISFKPTPQQFFGAKQALISSFRQKHTILDSLGVDKHLLIEFNQNFSKISAQDFVVDILLEKLKTQYLLIGDDFRFGANRTGDFAMLENFAKKHNFLVENTNSIEFNNVRISSSQIREHLKHGEFGRAKSMLGRGFNICGKIIHGKQLGRTIDFPTINISIKRETSPVLGVFAVTVVIDKSRYQGVANIGSRPTVNGKGVLLEVYIFNFNKDVYGKTADVVFEKKIRDEEKFDSFDELKQQIKLDANNAKDYFGIT